MMRMRSPRSTGKPATPARIIAARSPPAKPTTPSGRMPSVSIRRLSATQAAYVATVACAYAPDLKMSASCR